MSELSGNLRRSGLFRGLDDQQITTVISETTELNFPAGHIIFHEGDTADAMFVVLEGAVHVYTHDSDGREVVLARVEAGDHLGEQSLLPGATGRRSASVRAATPARLARVPKAVFEAALRVDDALRERLIDLGDAQARRDLEKLSSLARAFDLGAIEPLRRVLADGEALFRQGDDGDALYLIRAGRIALYSEEGGDRELLKRIERGGCFGELALIRRQPRSATAVAEGPTELLAISAERFEEVYARSTELREHLQTLEWLYELPRRGVVTQHAGAVSGQPEITTIYHLSDGRKFAAYRLVGEPFYALERLGTRPTAEQIETLAYADPAGKTRELRLGHDGAVIGLTARGLWPDAGLLHLFVLDNGRIGAPERERFLRSGMPMAPVVALAADEGEEVVCRCIYVTLGRIREVLARGATTFNSLQQETRCGTVCGGCAPRVVELLGASQWSLADVIEIRDEAPGVRSFELAPRDPSYPEAQPGQHVIVEGLVRGLRVRRPYTVSSARRNDGMVRITVKREEQGVFSAWLFDERPPDEPLRITPPRGDFILDRARPAAVCLVAGIGVTPALALTATVTDEELPAPLCVHYSGRSRSQMACLNELEEAARKQSNVELIVRETGREGRLGLADVAELVSRYAGADFFLCGPATYLEDVAGLLRQAGAPESQIHIETFTPSGAPVEQTIAVTEPAAWKRFLLAPPSPAPAPRLLNRALRRLGVALVHVFNGRGADWQVNGWQFNPLRLAERRLLARPAGIDPAVPYEHFGLVTLLSKGPFGYQTFCFDRLESLVEANRKLALQAQAEGRLLPPDTPDGNTFSYFFPAPPLLQFPPECAVDTGWTSAGPGRLVAAYVVRGRAAIDHVLRIGENTDRGPLPYHYLQQFFGRRDIKACPGHKPAGLFAGQLHDNATWSDDRALGVEMFALPVINDFTPGMTMATGEVCASVDEFIARDPDAVIDLNVLMSKIAYTIIIRAAFGNVDMAELHKYGEELSEATHSLLDYVTEFFMGRQSLPPDYAPLTHRSREIVRSIIDLLRDLDRRGQLTEHQRASLTVRAVLETAAEPGGGYDRLFTMFIPIIIGGHETTGITMTWAIYEMARNPELKMRVLAEIDAYRAAHGGRPIITENYDERPVIFALLAETLRMHPPISAHARAAIRPGVVPPDPETGIGGFSYPAGAMFTCSTVGVHRDPRRWTEPHTFRIERFFDGVSPDMPPVEQGRQVRRNIRAREEALDLLAFSEGTGRCLGQNFNTHEFILVLDALLSQYQFELAHPAREVSHTQTPITAPEKGMIGVRIRRRTDLDAAM